MNRRSFLKTVTGFIAGIFTLPSKVIGKKRSGTRLATEEETKLAVQGHFELYNAFGDKVLWIKGSTWPPSVIKVCDDKGVEFEYIPKE